MDKILHDPKDSKLWELWYVAYYGSCRILSINRRVPGTRAILIKDYKEIMLLVAPTSELAITAPVAAQQINEAKLCFVGDVSPHLPRHLYTVHSCASDTPPTEKR